MPNEFAVIFDLDGLLVDSEPLWSESARRLLIRRGKIYDPSLKPQIMGRHPLEVTRLMKAHYGLSEDDFELLSERLEILCEIYQEQGVNLLPGARALVEELRTNAVPMAVASGSPSGLIRLVLEKVGLLQELGVYVGSDCVTQGKPAPDLFLLAANRMGCDPERCIVLEDSAAGIAAARAADMWCIAVPSPELHIDAMTQAHLVVSRLDELSFSILRRLLTTSKT